MTFSFSTQASVRSLPCEVRKVSGQGLNFRTLSRRRKSCFSLGLSKRAASPISEYFLSITEETCPVSPRQGKRVIWGKGGREWRRILVLQFVELFLNIIQEFILLESCLTDTRVPAVKTPLECLDLHWSCGLHLRIVTSVSDRGRGSLSGCFSSNLWPGVRLREIYILGWGASCFC